MDKKFLSVAVAGVLAGSMAFSAQADVKLYGNVNISIDAVDVDGGSDDITMESNTSSIGVKGSGDLGGMKAIFQAEWQLEATERQNNGRNMTDRDQWVGLAGDFGKIRFGTISTSYKSHGAKVDPIYRTSLEGRSNGLQSGLHRGAGENGQGRMTNHIRFDSANYGGLGFTIDYSMDQDETDGKDDNAYGIGGHYKNGGIYVFADYLTNDHGGEDSAWKVGGTFKTGAIGLYAQYEADEGLISSTAEGVNSISGGDMWTIGGSYTMGNTMLYAGYGQKDDSNDVTNTEHDAWTLAVDHKMSKRTDIYAGFNQIDADASGETDTFSVGMRHKF